MTRLRPQKAKKGGGDNSSMSPLCTAKPPLVALDGVLLRTPVLSIRSITTDNPRASVPAYPRGAGAEAVLPTSSLQPTPGTVRLPWKWGRFWAGLLQGAVSAQELPLTLLRLSQSQPLSQSTLAQRPHSRGGPGPSWFLWNNKAVTEGRDGVRGFGPATDGFLPAGSSAFQVLTGRK